MTFIGVERSAASSARGAARLIGPGLVLSLALVPLTWWLPLFEARVPFLWRQQVSIASGLAELWRLDPLLCAVVFLFSVLAPLAKAAALVAVWYQAPLANARRQLDRLAILGKLAMTEVFLLAVIIVGIKGVGIGTVDRRRAAHVRRYRRAVAWGLHLGLGRSRQSRHRVPGYSAVAASRDRNALKVGQIPPCARSVPTGSFRHLSGGSVEHRTLVVPGSHGLISP